MPYAVLLETSGNQAFIFASNRQSEQVGASELIARSTTDWLLESLPQAVREHLEVGDGTWWKHLDDASRNKPLDRGGDVEVVAAASGKAVLLARCLNVATEVVRGVSQRALERAPGLTLLGVSVPYGEDAAEGGPRGVAEAVALAHRQIDEARATLPPPSSRALHDPLTAVCRTSGAPARVLQRLPDRRSAEPRGSQSAMCYRARDLALERLHRLLSEPVEHGRVLLPRAAKTLDSMRRVAVVHADGNGFGQLFLSLGRIVESAVDRDAADRDFVAMYRHLSAGLDDVTRQALLDALNELPTADERSAAPSVGERRPPAPAVLPLVLGGDDLTALIDAEVAWAVVTRFLAQFERRANSHPGVAAVLDAIEQLEGRRPWLSAAAGIAVVPRAYPFHAAYELAEGAASSAKRAKTIAAWDRGSCPSSVDVHVHYDVSGNDLSLVRSRRVGGSGEDAIHLVGGPYVLLDEAGLARFAEQSDGGPTPTWSRADLAARTVVRMNSWMDWVRRSMSGSQELEPDGSMQEGVSTSALDPAQVPGQLPVPGLSRSSLARLREGLTGGRRDLSATRTLLRPEHAKRLATMEERHLPLVTMRSTPPGEEGVPPARSSLLLDAIDLVASAQVAAEREEP